VTLYLRLLGYLKQYKGPFALAVLSIAAFAALDASSLALLIPFLRTLFAEPGEAMTADPLGEGALLEEPKLLDRFMDGTLGRFVDLNAPPEEAMRGIIFFLIFIFLLKNVFDYLRTYLVAWIEQSVTRDLRNDVYNHLVELDLVFFGRTRMGQIVSRVTHDVEQVRTLVTKEVARVIQSFFEIVAIVVFLSLISWKLTLVSLLALPGMFLIWGPLLRRVRRGDHAILRLAGEVNSHLQETLSGIRLVKASAAERHERERFRAVTWDYFKAFIRTERFRALSAPITESVGALGTILVLWYGTQLVLSTRELGGEDFIGFIVLSIRLYTPVKYLGKLPALLQPGLVAAERVFEFLDAPIEIRDRPDSLPFPGVQRDIVFERVSFAYRAGEPVLREVSFSAPAGTVTALVGPSGAGKTTVVDLLGRFYEATSGRILVDGKDIQSYSIRTLREALGIVSQDTVLFHDTVRANIAYAMDGVADEAVEAAARAAHAHDFIMSFPDGYGTIVGERGTQLSGGQRQRIAIARALLRNPPILILDEATSALDSESERLVQSALDRLLVGRTVFVIAHRLSTVQRADQILVLEKGEVVQRGKHQELVKERGGLYAHLSSLQHGSGSTPSEAVREEG
jgi:subfamily B ATP-binding cassette protein MsbA